MVVLFFHVHLEIIIILKIKKICVGVFMVVLLFYVLSKPDF
jgi:hypothetical protein